MTPFQRIFPLTGLSISEAADYLNVSQVTIQRWKSGKENPRDGSTVLNELSHLRQAIELASEGHQIDLPYEGAKKEALREFLRLQRAMSRSKT